MYFCLCNAISDAQVEQAVRDGALRLREIYAHRGGQAQCGRGTATILGALGSLSVETPALLASQE